MKKLYSLFAAVVFAATFNAQTIFTATFDDLNGTGGNDGTFSGNVGVSSLTAYTNAGWVFTASGGAKQSIKSGSGSSAGSVTTPILNTNFNGNGDLSFRAAGFSTDNTVLSVEVIGGGTIDTTTFALTNSAFSTFTAKISGGTSTTKLRFYSAGGGKRFFIDDIFVQAPTAAVVSANVTKANIIKNTVVDNNIIFAAKADVKIINAAGQVVKTASVNENSSLEVSSLPKGIYIVSAVIDGKAVAEKIIKK